VVRILASRAHAGGGNRSGVKRENLKFRDHDKDELSQLLEGNRPILSTSTHSPPPIFGELEGIAHRGDYDLSPTHTSTRASGSIYFDQELQLKLKEQGISPEDVKSKSR